MSYKSPIAYLWTDLETTGLEVVTGCREDQVIEAAFVITDFDHNPLAGFHDIVKLSNTAAKRIKNNEYVLNMHKANGLLKESALADASKTLSAIEQAVIDMIKENTSYQPGELQLNGSGVAHFDNAIIREQMPALSKWLDYSLADVGVFRRMSKVYAMRTIVNPTLSSYGDTKTHRAYDDVMAHIEESKKYMELFREKF